MDSFACERKLDLVPSNTLNCQKCGADVPILELPAEVKKRVSIIAYRTGRIQAVVELKASAKIGLGDAKAVVFHLSDEGGVCHRCRAQLTEQKEEQTCPKCHSLNLRW